MVCKEVIRELSNYLDGDLDPSLRQALEKHLQHCTDCSIVVSTARKTIELYCNKEPLPLPPDIQQEVEQALANKLRRQT